MNGLAESDRWPARERVGFHALSAILFVASGAVAIGCEMVYFRGLTLAFGATHLAAGVLLATFMTGLALGSEVGARFADRVLRPLRAYAIAETIAGLVTLALAFVFPRLRTLAPHLSTAPKILFIFVLIGAPTVAMGTTLPFLVAAGTRSRTSFLKVLSRLYGFNLAGGVFGALGVGFFLLPHIGALRSALALGFCGCAIGVAAWIGDRNIVADGQAPRNAELETSETLQAGRGSVWLAPSVATAIGMVSFGLQTAYNRALSLLMGSSAYTFTLIVAVVLAATALGGLLANRDETVTRITDVWSKVARRCLAAGISVYLGTILLYIAPFYLAHAAQTLSSMATMRLGLVAAVVAIPSYQVGAIFPAVASLFAEPRVGRAAGRAVLVTTAGNVIGALGAAFFLIPGVGAQSTLHIGSLAFIGLSLVCAWHAGASAFTGMSVAVGASVLFGLVVHPKWDPVAISAGSYRARSYRDLSRATRDTCNGHPFVQNRALFFRDGALGTVTVLGHAGGDACSLYSLRVGGKAEGSVFVAAPLSQRVDPNSTPLPLGDLPSEVLVGLLPAVLGEKNNEAFMVGWGTGISARALLSVGVKHLEARELEPAVLEAARIFDAQVQDDSRVHIQVDDARMALSRTANGQFDIIVSHPSNPWVIGSSALVSHEYFELLRSKLRDGGRALAWIQLYEIDNALVRTFVATFNSVFPNAHAFRLPGSRDVFFVGMKSSSPSDRMELETMLRAHITEAAEKALARAGLDVHQLIGAYVGNGSTLGRFAHGAAIESDDRSLLEYGIARHVIDGTGEDPETILKDF